MIDATGGEERRGRGSVSRRVWKAEVREVERRERSWRERREARWEDSGREGLDG
jgi:hypothetical protein